MAVRVVKMGWRNSSEKTEVEYGGVEASGETLAASGGESLAISNTFGRLALKTASDSQ